MKLPTFNELVSQAPFDIVTLLEDCGNTPQSPKWHPEGDVLVHIKIVFNRARESGNINQVLSAFFHDLGKVETTKKNKKGEWAAHGHEFISARLVEKHKDWIASFGADWEIVHAIVKDHMRVKLKDQMKPAKQKVLMENPVFHLLEEFTKFDNMKTLTDNELNV